MATLEPWELANACAAEPTNESLRVDLYQVIFSIQECVRIAAILLQPIMPSKMAQLLDSLGVAQERRMFEHARLGQDSEYGIHPNDLPQGTEGSRPHVAKTLFPPVAGVDHDQPGAGRKGQFNNTMYNMVKELIGQA